MRELENVVQRALILAPGDGIEAEHLLLSADVLQVAPMLATPAAVPPPPTIEAPAQAQPLVPAASPANMKDLERQHILDTLDKVGGSRKKAIELLGISERTLRYKLKQYREEGFFNDGEE